MRMTKKITSIVLAVMMVVSMMSVMAVTANAVGDYIAEEDYLTFTAVEDDSWVMMTVQSGSDFQYKKNGSTGWHDYNPDDYDRIELNKGEYVRFRGSDTISKKSGSRNFVIGGKVAASGNIMSLRLNSDSTSQGLTDECFINLFTECENLTAAPELPETTLAYECYEGMFHGCKNLTTAPALPATTLAYGCYADMFMDCTSLTEAPALPATSLARACYSGMFDGCTSLTELPALPATSLAQYCYQHMFYGCSSIRISDEAGTINGIKYSEEYRIPTVGTATPADDAVYAMFGATGGKFKGTPNINTTYYIGKPVYTVKWKNGDTVIETDADVESGAAPSFDGETPEKAEDETNTYEFSGWSDGNTTYGLSDTLPNVTADVTYTAQFTATPKHTVHTYTANPTFNWTQDASTGDWNCDKLTLTCTGCDLTQDYPVTGFFGASAVTCTANTDGSFTYSVSKKVDGVTYSDTKTYNANGVIKNDKQLKAAAKKGGEWELGADITKVLGVTCADGFVLDGNDHTVYKSESADSSPMFKSATKTAEFTLKNLTIVSNDGDDRYPAISSSTTANSNVINLDNVTINDYNIDADNNGAVLAWGQATVNMNDCDINSDSQYDVWVGSAGEVNITGGDTGNVYLHSYSGTGAALSAAGNANIDKITLDTTVTTTLKADIGRATVGAIEANGDIPSEVVVIDPAVSSVSAPDGYEWTFSEEEGRKTLAPIDPENPLQGKAQIIGYQKKAVQADAEGNGVRILTKIDRDWLEANADEYGYVVAKVSGKAQDTANFSAMKKDGGNGEKTIDCTGTYNNGIDGINNTYVTLAVNGMTDGQQVAARFYVVVNGVTYYANYVNTISYDGIIATYTA